MGGAAGWWRTWALFAGAFALVGATWALTSPPYAPPDEAAHVVRAASVGTGQLLGEVRVVDDERGVRAHEHVVVVPAALRRVHEVAVCTIHGGEPASCAGPLGHADGRAEVPTTAGAYQPLFYALTGWPYAAVPADAALHVARLAHVAAGATLLGAAVATARELGGRTAVAATALAVTPAVPYLLGSVNPSGLEIAAALLLWTAGLAALVARAPHHLPLAAVAMGVLAWSRPLSPFLGGGIVACLLLAAATRERLRDLLRGRAPAWIALAAAAALGSLVWLDVAGGLSAFVGVPDPDRSVAEAITRSLGYTGGRLVELVGVLGWLDTPLPEWLVAAWAVAALGTAAAAGLVATRRERWVGAALVLAVVALPVVAETLRAAQLGTFWQGRYTLPAAVGLLVLAGSVLGRDAPTPPSGPRAGRVPGAVRRHLPAVAAGVAGGGHAAAQLTAMGRYSRGLAVPGTALRWQPGWDAPVPDALVPVLVLAGAAAVAGAIALTPAARERTPRRRAEGATA